MICECLLWLSLASYHFDRSKDYREINPGIFLEKDQYVGGIYHNSFSRTTVFGARVFSLVPDGRFSLLAGIGSGYDHHLVGGFRYRQGRFAVIFVPPIGKYTKGLVAVNALLQ